MQHRPVILAIETTGPLASVALSGVCEDSREGILERVNQTHYSHLEEIAPMVKGILREAGIGPEALDAIAVSRGPGSFTGIRIGMATAKAFAQIWSKPLVSVPTLAAFAFSDAAEGLVCPLFDARRSQVYAGVYRPGSKVPLLEDGAYDVPDYLEKLRALAADGCICRFFGDGSDVYREVLEASGLACAFAPEEQRYQRAYAGLRLALQLYEEGCLTDCYRAQPEYLRLAEAERKLKAGELRRMP